MRYPDTSLSEGRLRLGTALTDMSRKIGVTNADVDALGEVLGEARDGRALNGRVAQITWEQIPRKGSG